MVCITLSQPSDLAPEALRLDESGAGAPDGVLAGHNGPLVERGRAALLRPAMPVPTQNAAGGAGERPVRRRAAG